MRILIKAFSLSIICSVGYGLEWYVAVFLCGVGERLVGKLLKGADNTEARVAWFDDIIDVAILGCIIRIGEEF